jgi:hypothetical protein
LTEIKNRVKARVTSPKQENKPQEKVKSLIQESKVNERATPVDRVDPETRNWAIAFAGYDKIRVERLLNSIRRSTENTVHSPIKHQYSKCCHR